MAPESAVNETLTVRSLIYRCVCGEKVVMDDEERTTCPTCSRRINVRGLDASQTLSFCTTVPDDQHDSTSRLLASQEDPDRSGEQLGHFVLEQRLGHGGMGAVYRALDKSLRRYVAVKVLKCGSAGGSSSQRVAKLLDEAVAQARVNHPNVVTIYYVGCEQDEPFFAMELLPGPTLDRVLKDGPLPFKKVIQYARQVVSALTDASRLGIVHGDIKPSNLIQTASGAIKLGDFGLAQTEETGPSEGLSGTLSYLAPELIDGHVASEQSDMYALGVTLFELTFGRRPHKVQGETLTAQLMSQREAEVEFPEKWPVDVPDRWRRVLQRLLAKDPRERYATYELLDLDLKAMSPVGYTKAGIISRALAYATDVAAQAAAIAPLIVPVVLINENHLLENSSPWLWGLLYPLLVALPLMVPLAFSWWEWHGWTTPGRYLFQLRVVDSHGLTLPKRRRIIRSFLRNGFVWIALLTIPSSGLGELGAMFGMLDELFVFINMLPVLGPKRLALHDRITRSHVVLDTRTAHS